MVAIQPGCLGYFVLFRVQYHFIIKRGKRRLKIRRTKPFLECFLVIVHSELRTWPKEEQEEPLRYTYVDSTGLK